MTKFSVPSTEKSIKSSNRFRNIANPPIVSANKHAVKKPGTYCRNGGLRPLGETGTGCGAGAHHERRFDHQGTAGGIALDLGAYQVHAALSEFLEVLSHGGQRRHEVGGFGLVVKANHGDVFRNPDTLLAERPQQSERHLVVADEHCGGAALFCQLLPDPVPAVRTPVPLDQKL